MNGRFIEAHVLFPPDINIKKLSKIINQEKILFVIHEYDLLFFTCPISIERWKIDQEIFALLKHEHDILPDTLTKHEWGMLQNSVQWKKCQLEIFKILVSEKILKVI
ncbi:MAG: hypothetical protein ACTSWE_08005 [Promethearchaeota archaeon]